MLRSAQTAGKAHWSAPPRINPVATHLGNSPIPQASIVDRQAGPPPPGSRGQAGGSGGCGRRGRKS